MADETKKTDELAAKIEMTTPPAPAAASGARFPRLPMSARIRQRSG